jgi:O-antigen/teichoic acid export membrane protein
VTDAIDAPDLEEEEIEAREIAGSSALGSNSLLTAVLVGSGATVVVGVLGVVRTKALALGLEPDGLGLYGQVLTVLTALSAASGLGLGLGTTRVVAESRKRGDRDGLKTALDVSFAVPLLISALIAVAMAATAGLLAPWLLEDDRSMLIVLAALAVPGVVLQGPSLHALQGFRDVVGVQGANVFFGVVLTVVSIAGLLVAGLEGAVVGLAVGNVFYAGALAWRLRGFLRQAGIKLSLAAGLRPTHLRSGVVRSMLGIGFASLFVGMAATLAELAVRTIVLKGEGADAAGFFQALQLVSVQLIGVIVASAVFLSFTAITEAHALQDRALAQKTIDDTLRLTLLLVLPLLVTLGLFKEEVVRALFSASFAEAGDLLPRQLAGDALRTGAWVLGAALVPLGLTRLWAGFTVVTIAVYLAAAGILVPRYGLDGAVTAYVIEWAVSAVLIAFALARRGFFRPSALTTRTLACALAVAGIAIAPEIAWPLAALGSVGFVALLAAVGTAPDERAAIIGRIISKRRR